MNEGQANEKAKRARDWHFCYGSGEGLHITQQKELASKTLCDQLVVSRDWPKHEKGARVCEKCMAVLMQIYQEAQVLFSKDDAVETYASNR